MTFPVPKLAGLEPAVDVSSQASRHVGDTVSAGIYPGGSSADAEHGERPSITVVIPTLNEAENLPHVLPYIPAWVDEILIVDGASTDGTPEVARKLSDKVTVIQQKGRGKGAALRTGFAAARGEIIVMMDADYSMDPAEIPLFCAALLSGADFVKGSRFLQGAGTADMEFHRMMGNWAFVVAVRILFGGQYSDLCYGYNAFWRRVLPQLSLDCDGFEIETLMNLRALRAGLKVVEVPSFENPRKFGYSRLRAIPDGWRVLKTIVRERLSRRLPRPKSPHPHGQFGMRSQANNLPQRMNLSNGKPDTGRF